MKKIILTVVFIAMLSSCSYGAASDDMSVYVRQDVFDAKMEAFMAEIRLSHEQIRREIQETYSKTHNELQGLSARITVVEGRMSSLEIMIYWVLGTLAVVFTALAIMLTLRSDRKETPVKEIYTPAFTLDDVKRLIAEAKLGVVQADAFK